jgi:hypothetical protein
MKSKKNSDLPHHERPLKLNFGEKINSKKQIFLIMSGL